MKAHWNKTTFKCTEKTDWGYKQGYCTVCGADMAISHEGNVRHYSSHEKTRPKRITLDEALRPTEMTCVECGATMSVYPCPIPEGTGVCPNCSPNWLDSFAEFMMNQERTHRGLATYKPLEGKVQVLRIKNMWVQCKPGEDAKDLMDKIEALIKRFSEDGNWTFKYDIEG